MATDDNRQGSFYRAPDIFDVTALAVDALGRKAVAALLRPGRDPEATSKWVSNCLDRKRRDHFKPDDLEKIFRAAQERGFHDAKHALDRLLGYHPAPPMSLQEEKDEVLRQVQERFEAMNRGQKELAALMARYGQLTAGEAKKGRQR